MRFLFEDHVLDIDRRELRRAGAAPIALEPQVFDLLVYLVRNRDRVVSKDDLIEAVWDGRVVSDSTLTSRITAVHKAVGDSGHERRLIRTVAPRGSGSSAMSRKCGDPLTARLGSGRPGTRARLRRSLQGSWNRRLT